MSIWNNPRGKVLWSGLREGMSQEGLVWIPYSVSVQQTQAVPFPHGCKTHQCLKPRPGGWSACMFWESVYSLQKPLCSLRCMLAVSVPVWWPHCHPAPQRCLADELSLSSRGSPCLPGDHNSASQLAPAKPLSPTEHPWWQRVPVVLSSFGAFSEPSPSHSRT